MTIKEIKREKMKVFLDTSVLLKAFPLYRTYITEDKPLEYLPKYLIDDDTEKYIFEKSIYEVYMAFRGVGGKKPSEGRGDWAIRHLKNKEKDPREISGLTSKFHKGNVNLAKYWVNQIEEVDVDSIEGYSKEFDIVEDKEVFEDYLSSLRSLINQNNLFNSLCEEFQDMLQSFNITILTYIEIFSVIDEDKFHSFITPYNLDYFVRSTIIPSEDFEIVYAAERISADMFLLEDKELKECSNSLGLNNFLHTNAFCSIYDYETKKNEIFEYKGFKKQE